MKEATIRCIVNAPSSEVRDWLVEHRDWYMPPAEQPYHMLLHFADIKRESSIASFVTLGDKDGSNRFVLASQPHPFLQILVCPMSDQETQICGVVLIGVLNEAAKKREVWDAVPTMLEDAIDIFKKVADTWPEARDAIAEGVTGLRNRHGVEMIEVTDSNSELRSLLPKRPTFRWRWEAIWAAIEPHVRAGKSYDQIRGALTKEGKADLRCCDQTMSQIARAGMAGLLS